MVTMAMPATTRSERAASTMAPPGIWPMSDTMPAVDCTRPISNCVQRCPVRKTDTNAHKPVFTPATKKTNQSSPRRLRGDGCNGGSLPSDAGGGDKASGGKASGEKALGDKAFGG